MYVGRNAGRYAGRRNGCRTLDWLVWLAGLTMSSVFGDLMSFRSSCASSSICICQPRNFFDIKFAYMDMLRRAYLGVIGGTRAIAVDWRWIDSGRIWTWRRD